MVIYTTKGTASKASQDVIRKDKHLIDWLNYLHQEMKKPENIIPYENKEEFDAYKKFMAQAFYCSGFENKKNPSKPLTPDAAPRKVTKNAEPIRDYVVIDYDGFTDKELADTLPDKVHDLFKDYDYACYPSASYPAKPRYRVVLMVKPFLTKFTYGKVVNNIIDLIGFPPDDDSNEQITHLMNAPMYSSNEAPSHAVFNKTGESFNVSEMVQDAEDQASEKQTKKTKTEDITTTLEKDTLEKALDAFIENDNVLHQLENNYNYFWKLTESVAMANINQTITREFAENIMIKIALGKPEWEQDNINELDNQIRKLNQDPSKQKLVQPITSYLPIVAQYSGVKNLAQLLDSMLPSSFEPDPQIRPDQVADMISRFFEFALLPTQGQSDADNIAIFNPLTGAWEHDADEFISMITVIKPGVTQNQVNTILMQWGAIARRKDEVIDPYNKTRFLLFKNGALDVKTLKLHDFSDPIIRESEFTKRHKINLNWNPEPELKVFKNDARNGGDWSIDKFIGGYAYNTPHLIEYFLFGLSLGLFSGHNSSVHFDIQGVSRLGKSTLNGIYNSLFSGRIAITTYNQLNQPFPLTSYDPDTAIIWIKECNIGAQPLNDEFGIPFYDGLADNQIRLSVKHGGDIIVDNPPQVYIDGTQFIQASEIQTGPAGRTLAFKLPVPTEEERDAFYSNAIDEKFKDETVMQYLVYQMVQAFRNIVPEHRIDNFKMNLASKRDLELLPEEALEWRHEFVNADINIKAWFDEELLPFLILEPEKDKNETAMKKKRPLHMLILHKMYLASVRRKSKSGKDDRYAQGFDRFEKNVKPLFNEYNIELDFETGCSIDKRWANATPRRKVNDPDNVAIDWQEYQEAYVMPEELASAQEMPDLFGKKKTGWFTMIDHTKQKTKK